MPSYLFNNVPDTYQLVCDLKEVRGISRRGLSVQSNASRVVWIRIGEPTDTYMQEFAFLPNIAVLLDYASDLLKYKVYIRAEMPIQNRTVIVTFW